MAVCCSINMRIFKTIEFLVLLLFVTFSCRAAPEKYPRADISSPTDSPAAMVIGEAESAGDHYDQRQNGTENYRIHVDGLVVVVAPVEALLLAGGLPGAGDSNIFGGQQGITNEKPLEPVKPAESSSKPEPSTETIKDKSLDSQSSHRPSLRLMSLLSPFLRRVHSHH